MRYGMAADMMSRPMHLMVRTADVMHHRIGRVPRAEVGIDRRRLARLIGDNLSRRRWNHRNGRNLAVSIRESRDDTENHDHCHEHNTEPRQILGALLVPVVMMMTVMMMVRHLPASNVKGPRTGAAPNPGVGITKGW